MNKLVNYTSSSEDEDDEEVVKKRMKIQLPQPFQRDKKEESSQQQQHQGRKRQIPHQEGNWSSHLYIDCSHFQEILNEITLKYPQIEKIESPHLSLSKNFILKFHWIENLTLVLSKNIKFSPFTLKFDTLNIKFLSNEDNSRYFACMVIDDSCELILKNLIEQIDKSLLEFELPKYYEKSIFHISLFWKLTAFSDDEKELIREEMMKFDSCIFDKIINCIHFKAGNKTKIIHAI